MALSGPTKLRERMAPAEFGYVVLAGETVYEGGLVALNAAGTLQRVQTAGSVVCVGIADGTRINNPSGNDVRAVRCRKGTWQLNVANATAANVGQDVYATDDATVILATPVATATANAGNTGNGTIANSGTAALAAGAGAKMGAYALAVTNVGTAATLFGVTDPNGDVMASGTVGVKYVDQALTLEVVQGTTAFAVADGFTITVAQTGLLAGKLVGIDGGLTFVQLSNTY